MSLFEILGVVLLAAAVQPLVQRRLLESARARLRREIEQERGSRLILLAHRQETVSMLGVPVMSYIDIQDAEEIIHAIRQTPKDTPIDIVLHTPGGLALASLQIARALAAHPAPVTALVPHYAMSGGTLIALAADQIVMCQHAALGPIDPQIGPYPAASVVRAVALKEDRHIEDATLILADQAEMALEQLRRSVIGLLRPRYRQDVAEFIAAEMSQGRWTHDYPITVEEARQLGLRVETDMSEAVLEMMRLYPQQTRGPRSVEYGAGRKARHEDSGSMPETEQPPREPKPADHVSGGPPS